MHEQWEENWRLLMEARREEMTRECQRQREEACRKVTGDVLNMMSGSLMQTSLLDPYSQTAGESFARAQTLAMQAALAYAGVPYGRV